MISIKDSVTNLDRIHQSREFAVECYLTAIQCMAQYAVEMDPETTGTYRRYLTALAADVSTGEDAALQDSRATLRGLLRENRKKSAEYLDTLREELASTARSLQEIMDALAQGDGEQEQVMRKAVGVLRHAAESPSATGIRSVVQAAAGQIERGLDEMRKLHQLTITQFQEEVRMLHRRIDSLESAARVESLTRLFTRPEMEQRVQSLKPGSCLLMIRAGGLRFAEAHFRPSVAEELAGAFAGRLRNALPPDSVIGRWGYEDVLAIITAQRTEAQAEARKIAEHLSGSYSCLLDGKAVRPSLQLSVGVVEAGGDPPERLLERVDAFFTGG